MFKINKWKQKYKKMIKYNVKNGDKKKWFKKINRWKQKNNKLIRKKIKKVNIQNHNQKKYNNKKRIKIKIYKLLIKMRYKLIKKQLPIKMIVNLSEKNGIRIKQK